MPKMPKIEVRLRRIDFTELERGAKEVNFADLGFPIVQTAHRSDCHKNDGAQRL
jgi:hypothetical protein